MNSRRFHALTALACVTIIFGMVARPSTGQPPPRAAARPGVTPAQAREAAEQIARDVREARTLAERIGDRKLREKMELILSRAELRARDLSADLDKAVAMAPIAPMPIPAEEFARLVNGLKATNFDREKIKYVENFCTTRPLSCAQAAALTKCFDFDNDRIKAAVALYPKLIDRNNFNDVLATFIFDTGRETTRKAVGLK